MLCFKTCVYFISLITLTSHLTLKTQKKQKKKQGQKYETDLPGVFVSACRLLLGGTEGAGVELCSEIDTWQETGI